MSTTRDAARTRTMLLARARGRRDALEAEWGERPHRPARDAESDRAGAPVPDNVGAFARQAYLWRADVVVTDDAGRVLLVPDGDGWRLPGGPGDRTETVEDAAERHAARAVGADAAVSDLLWTQFVEFDYGTVVFPALRVVYAVTAADVDAVAGEWFVPAELPGGFADRDAFIDHVQSV